MGFYRLDIDYTPCHAYFCMYRFARLYAASVFLLPFLINMCVFYSVIKRNPFPSPFKVSLMANITTIFFSLFDLWMKCDQGVQELADPFCFAIWDNSRTPFSSYVRAPADSYGWFITHQNDSGSTFLEQRKNVFTKSAYGGVSLDDSANNVEFVLRCICLAVWMTLREIRNSR
mgnify:CR=1 FL=1